MFTCTHVCTDSCVKDQLACGMCECGQVFTCSLLKMYVTLNTTVYVTTDLCACTYVIIKCEGLNTTVYVTTDLCACTYVIIKCEGVILLP